MRLRRRVLVVLSAWNFSTPDYPYAGIVFSVLAALTDRARLALEKRFRDNCSRNEIAAALQISEHGAKNLMQRAKQQLRECIENKLK